MCIKCDQMALKSLVNAVANHHKRVDERRAAEVNRVLNEQLRQVKQDREQMHIEHENLMSAYKALLESQRLLILSLE